MEGRLDMAIDEALAEAVGAGDSPPVGPAVRIFPAHACPWAGSRRRRGSTRRAASQRTASPSSAARPADTRCSTTTSSPTPSRFPRRDAGPLHRRSRAGNARCTCSSRACSCAGLSNLGITGTINAAQRGRHPQPRLLRLRGRVRDRRAATGRKLIGSAQMTTRRAILQHGSIPLQNPGQRVFRYLEAAQPLDSHPPSCLNEEAGRALSFEEVREAFARAFRDEPGRRATPSCCRAEQERAERILGAEVRDRRVEPRMLSTRRRSALPSCAACCCLLPVRWASALSFSDPGDPAVLAARIAGAMTDEELLGQVFFLGWQGVGPSADILRWIGTREIGGVKIFPRNVSDLAVPRAGRGRPCRSWRRAAGSASRCSSPPTRRAAGSGRSRTRPRSRRATSPSARPASRETRTAPATTSAGSWPRSASTWTSRPPRTCTRTPRRASSARAPSARTRRTTGLLSAAYARGMADAGVLCTAKHFPGHGSADQDSHGHLPKIDVSLDQLLDRDLIPYRILIREGIPAIMTGHLAFPRIIGSLTPASLSPFFLQSVLRDKLGFTGHRDHRRHGDGGRAGGRPGHRPAPAAARWRRATTWCSSPTRPPRRSAPGRRCVAAVRDDRRIPRRPPGVGDSGSWRRSSAPSAPAPAGAARGSVDVHERRCPPPGAKDFFAQVSARAVTLIAGARIPYRPARGEKILLCGQFPEFLAEGLRRYPGRRDAALPLHARSTARGPRTGRRCARAPPAYDTVIFCLANYNSLDVLQDLKGMGRKVIVISALSPVYLSEAPWVQTAIAVYGDGRDSFRAGFGVLAGDFARHRRASRRTFRAGRADELAAGGPTGPGRAPRVPPPRGSPVRPLHLAPARRRARIRGLPGHRSTRAPCGTASCTPPAVSCCPPFPPAGRTAGALRTLLGDLRPMVHSIMGVGRCVDVGRGEPSAAADHARRVLPDDPGAGARAPRAPAGSPRPPRPQGGPVRRGRSSFPLQKCYELEEVVITPAHFNDGQCMKSPEASPCASSWCTSRSWTESRWPRPRRTRAGTRWTRSAACTRCPQERGKGLGKAVVSELLKTVFIDKQEACLFVKKHNRPAIALYERLGFAPVTDYVISYYGL